MSIKNNTTSLQSLLTIVNTLPDNAGGVSLPELTNPTSEDEVFLNKEYIDADGTKKRGTFTINQELNNQDILIVQLQNALEEKVAASSSEELPYITGITTVNTSTTFTIPELIGYSNVMLYKIDLVSTYIITTTNYPPFAFVTLDSGAVVACEKINDNILTSVDDWTYDSNTGTFTGSNTYGKETNFIYVAW